MSDLDEELDRLNSNINGVISKISELNNRVEELEETVDDLQDTVTILENVVDVDLDRKSYEELTREDKAREIQTALIKEAESSSTGKAAMNFREVRLLFNGRPSTGHCYDLMDLAAQEQGFDYQERDADGNNRIVVDLEDVKESLLVHAVNNGGD